MNKKFGKFECKIVANFMGKLCEGKFWWSFGEKIWLVFFGWETSEFTELFVKKTKKFLKALEIGSQKPPQKLPSNPSEFQHAINSRSSPSNKDCGQ